MTDTTSPDDLMEAAKLNFHLLAETWAKLAEVVPEKSTAKFITTINGHEIRMAIAAMKGGE
jgi:hypothetical protein